MLEAGGVKLPPRCISASKLARNEIPTATPMFLGSNCSIVLSVKLPDGTGSQKSKMAAEKMEFHVAQLINMIATKFQRLNHIFERRQHRKTNGRTV